MVNDGRGGREWNNAEALRKERETGQGATLPRCRGETPMHGLNLNYNLKLKCTSKDLHAAIDAAYAVDMASALQTLVAVGGCPECERQNISVDGQSCRDCSASDYYADE